MIISGRPNPPPLWSAPEIAEAVNGRIIKWGRPGSISTDTRTLHPGQWFLPLVGQNFDAHNFITPQLSAKGAVGVISNQVCENWDKGLIQVDDSTSDSLQKLAIFARKRFNGCLIGLTGSVGKTTTRTMIALALESIGSVYQSPENWNNDIGVALSLVGIPRNLRILSLEEVSTAKGEILRDALPGDVCVLNADDPLVMSLPVPEVVEKVLFGRRQGSDVRLVAAQSVDGGLKVEVVLDNNEDTVKFVIPSPGLHLALNACAAAAVATSLGVPLALVGKSLSQFIPVPGRSELEITRNDIKIINDVYNASPVSTKCAIDSLRAIDCYGKRVAILGDMLELGPTEIKLHELTLQHCLDSCIDVVALVGTRFLAAAENLKVDLEINLVGAYDSESLASKILEYVDCGDVVLVKGSRGMKMEKIVHVIKPMFEQSMPETFRDLHR
ncbi:hypothetical protein DH2020_044001 [Rehmannia glutinosa]|uniref:UDP-MurNAc-pentapeptide synthetase n=1 Tax=Rehmannia glutinosa TaxID=99300 RepID=A0ABR0UIZ6_REHGL